MLSKEDDFSIQVPTGLYNAISKNYGPHYTSIISARQVVTLNSLEGVISSIKSKLLQFVLDIADLFKSRVTLNKEIVKACKKYGIKTNMLLLSLKYLYKIFELKK